MTTDQRINRAIALVEEADDKHREALRMLKGNCRVAAECIVNAQGFNLDAITHMQTRPLKRKKKIQKRA